MVECGDQVLQTQMFTNLFLRLFSELVAIAIVLPSPSYRDCGSEQTLSQFHTHQRVVLGERESCVRGSCVCYLILIREALVASAVVLLDMVGQLGDEDRCQGHGRSS